MQYLHDAVSGGYIPKLLGIYERELHPVISRLAGFGIDGIVNIGASDGYYAVGLARCLPGTRVFAFERESRGQDFIRHIADRNGVGHQVVVRGNCDLDDLQGTVAPLTNPAVICDVEGFEDALLDPEKVPGLRGALILVEIHDGKNPEVSARIRRRFETTHTIEVIWQQKRVASEFPFVTNYTRSLSSEHLAAAVDEGRPVRAGALPMSWFFMIPRQSVPC
jgi:hypothetical protein